MPRDRYFWIAIGFGIPVLAVTVYEMLSGATGGVISWVQFGLAVPLVVLLTWVPLVQAVSRRDWLSPWPLAAIASVSCLVLAVWSLLDPASARLGLGGPYLIFIALTAMIWAAGYSLASKALGNVDNPLPPGPDRLVKWTLIVLPIAAVAAAVIWTVLDQSGSPARIALLAALATLAVGPPVTLTFGLSALLLIGALRGSEVGVRPTSWRCVGLDRKIDCVLFSDASLFVSQDPSILDFDVAEGIDSGRLVSLLKTLDSLKPSRLERLPGMGYVAELDEGQVVVGSAELLESRGISTAGFEDNVKRSLAAGAKPTLIAKSGTCMGFMSLAFNLRMEAALVVESLKAAGFKCMAPRPVEPEAIQALKRLPSVQVLETEGHRLAQTMDRMRAEGQRIALVSGPELNAELSGRADLAVVLGCSPQAVPANADVILESADLDGTLHGISLAALLSRLGRRIRIAVAAPHAVVLVLAIGLLQGTTGLGTSPLLASGALAAACALIMLQAMPASSWEPSDKIEKALAGAVDALSRASEGNKSIH